MKKFILFFSINLLCFLAVAQTQPTLPNTSSINTCFPDTTGYKVITVGPVGRDYTDLQLAINNALQGSVLVLDAGATFNGSFSLPNKTGSGWIIITSSQISLLPKQNIRINPQGITGNGTYLKQVDAMPKIVTTNPSGLPAFYTQANAHHYRLVGLHITVDPTLQNSYGVVVLGDASSAQNTFGVIPHDLIIDRCYIHGNATGPIMKVGIILNCANSAVINSYISEFHSVGYDAQAIGGTNGPGPFKVINNYLEGSGENILFGGGAAAVPNLVPSDIEVRNNYFFKPLSWRVGDASYAGIHWTIKNLFELKTGKRVLLDGNILENSWADLPIGQSGYAILLTIRTEGGGSPQADVSDITITNNIIRHAGAGISISGHDNGGTGIQSMRIKIANNLWEDISGPKYGDGNTAGPNDGILIQMGDPTDVIVDHNTVFESGAITWVYDTVNNFVFTNNMANCFLSSGGYQGIYGPGFAQGGNGPMAFYFPDLTDGNKHFNKNVLIGGNSSKYTNYATLSQNYFPAAAANVNFVDYANGSSDYHNYALAGNSIYKNAGSDGKDIGADFTQLDAALSPGASCITTSINTINKAEETISIYPNPSSGMFYIKTNDQNKLVNLYVCNMFGEQVYNEIFKEKSEIDLSGLSKGVYIITLRTDNRSITKKLVLNE